MATEEAPLIDVRISELAEAHGISEEQGTSMVERDEPWYCEVNDEYTVAVNTDEPNDLDPPESDCMAVEDADPFRMVVWKNGWVVYLGPQGTSIVGGDEAEDHLIERLETAINYAGGDYSDPEPHHD